MNTRGEDMEQDQFVTDLLSVYKTEAGKRVLTELWREHVVGNLMVVDCQRLTDYQLGKRDLVLGLFRDLKLTNPTMENDND